MQRPVQLFVIPKDRAPAGPPNPPENLSIEGRALDELRDAVRREIEARGLRARSVSFGPKGIVAYAEERA